MKSIITIIILSAFLAGCGSSKTITTSTETVKQGKQSIEDTIVEENGNAAIGVWNITTETPRGKRTGTLTIYKKSGRLKAKSDRGTYTITQDGNTLKWVTTMNTPMGSMTLRNQVKVSGNKMSGTATMSSGPMAGKEMIISGVRK